MDEDFRRIVVSAMHGEFTRCCEDREEFWLTVTELLAMGHVVSLEYCAADEEYHQ